MNSGLYEIPGFSATWIAAARASWLALPVTKLSNENARFRRSTLQNRRYFACTALRRLPTRARRHRRRVREPADAEVATGSLGGEPLDASDEALAHVFEHEAVGCSENQRVGPGTGFQRKRPDPGIELLRGEFLPESTQAGVPEVLHLMVGRGELEFYLLRYELSTAASALSGQAQRFDNALARTL